MGRHSASIKIFACLCVLSLVSGVSIRKNDKARVLDETTTVISTGDEISLQDEITTEGGVVTEDQFLADSQPTTVGVTTDEVNDDENELFREKRDANGGPVTENVPSEEPSANNDDIEQVEETTPVAFSSGSFNGDDFPEFVRPTTPDPDATYENYTEPLFDMIELRKELEAEGVNFTGPYVRGRAACKCGVPANRIVGGSPGSIREYPWTVGLTRGGKPYCGGTLINSLFIVTASHCVDGQSANRMSVVIGEQDYNSASDGANPQRYPVSRIYMHERYNSKNIDNDIALLRLSTPVRLGGTNIPVCLPASNDNDFAGEIATVAGWGATSQGGSTSSHLRKVDVPVLSNTACNGPKSRYSGKITQNMMCAGYLETGGKDSCQGDSGGPLTIPNGGRSTLIGIVSWGYGCAQAGAPGVYTRVGRYPEWILSKTRGADWCQG